MLSCEICKIFKNNYFEEHLRTTAFNGSIKLILKRKNESIQIKLIGELQVTERKDKNQQKKESMLVRISS